MTGPILSDFYVMAPLFIALSLGTLAFAGLFLLVEIGIRDGDRPGDAEVIVALWTSGQPDEPRPVLVTEIRNPSSRPVLAGLSAHRTLIPGWLAAPSSTVPFRTARRRLRAEAYEVVGIVPASGVARFTVPVTRTGRRYRLTAAVGQGDRRLRVHRIPVDVTARLESPRLSSFPQVL
jgi:hypothetical protein